MIALWLFRIVIVVPLVALSALALGSCVPPGNQSVNVFQGSAVEDYPGSIQNASGPVVTSDSGYTAAWINGGAAFAVAVEGVTGCVPISKTFALSGSNRIDIALPSTPDTACNGDPGAHTVVFPTPPDINPDMLLTITIHGTSLELPAVSSLQD